MAKPLNILVLRLSAMGDVAMTVPVLRALAQQYPELKITVVTRAFFVPVFRGIDNLTVYPAEVKAKHKGVLGLYKLAQELNQNNFCFVADLHNVLRTKILKRFLHCKRFVSIDKGRKEKKQLISGKRFEPLKTTHERYADVFAALGFPIDLLEPTFPEKAHINSKTQALIGGQPQKLIGIAPFAAHEGKMYPLHLTKKVIEVLSEDYKIVLFGGGKKEIAVLNAIEATYKNTVNLAGKLSFDEELDVLSNLDVMLSMDSGNAHLAAMLGVKTVTIWGVTHPYAGFAPFNQPQHHALLANREQFPLIPTSVYGNKHPESYKQAAGSIAPETVIAKIREVV